jgi:hypothetical protein
MTERSGAAAADSLIELLATTVQRADVAPLESTVSYGSFWTRARRGCPM